MFGLAGFSFHDPAILRLYLRYYREDVVLGINLPVPPHDATTGALGSSYTMIELSSLFYDGVPPHIAEQEQPADTYCNRIYDLRPWFSRSRPR